MQIGLSKHVRVRAMIAYRMHMRHENEQADNSAVQKQSGRALIGSLSWRVG